MKKCTKCEKEFPATDEYFYKQTLKNGTVALKANCKVCQNTYRQAWWRENKRKVANNRMLKKYGITLDDKESLLAEQGGKCRICGAAESGGRWSWHLDHDHTTGKVRGVLCHNCNRGLGYFRDNADNLKRAADYLEF